MLIFFISFSITLILIKYSIPYLKKYFSAIPNIRSSHLSIKPSGAGIIIASITTFLGILNSFYLPLFAFPLAIIGFIDDNTGIDDKNNNEFYQDVGDKEKRHFKNKVNVVLADGSKVYQHICHWNSTDKYFCTTSESYWDQFEKH